MTYEIGAPDPKNRIAPAGMFCLLCVDFFEGPFAEFPAGVFPKKEAALASGRKQKGTSDLLKYYVYDDEGKFVAEAE